MNIFSNPSQQWLQRVKYYFSSHERSTAIFLLFMVICPAASSAADITFNVSLVGQLDPFAGNNRYGDVWGEGNYAYIGSFGGSGVGVIDISNPSAPVLASTYLPASGGQFKDVKVHNGVGYFASDNGGGVHIVDLSNPTSPALFSTITSAESGYDSIHNVFYDNGFLYEADSHTPTVKVFDVSNPASPTFVRNIVTTDSSFIHDITVINSRMFTSGFGGTTDIYDVTNIGSTAPTLLGTASSGSNSHSTWVSPDGNTLVSAREISGGDIRIFDISNPASPTLASSFTGSQLGIDGISPHNPVIFGNLLFTSWYQAGLQVHDISNPFNPVYVGAYDTFPGGVGAPGSIAGFDGNWGVYPFLGLDRVLLSDLDGGLFIVDASSVPVPSAVWLFLSGLMALGLRFKRSNHLQKGTDLFEPFRQAYRGGEFRAQINLSPLVVQKERRGEGRNPPPTFTMLPGF